MLLEMQEDGCIDQRILWGETVSALVLCCGYQNRRVERNDFGNLYEPRAHRLQVLGFLVSAINEQGSQMPESAEPICIGCRPSQLSQFVIEFGFHALTLLVAPHEGFVRFSQGISGYDKLHTTRFAQTQNVFTTCVLLLEQGKFKHEV